MFTTIFGTLFPPMGQYRGRYVVATKTSKSAEKNGWKVSKGDTVQIICEVHSWQQVCTGYDVVNVTTDEGRIFYMTKQEYNALT